jgi:hypothetical protein
VPSSVRLTVMVERKAAHPELPRFAVVPAAAIAKWKLSGTTVVEGTINGAPMGRRTIKPWDERRWFI